MPSPSVTLSGAGQNTSALTATAVNLNSATITDGAGNAVNPSISGLTQSGPQIDTTPLINSIVESPSTGDLNAGNTITLTVALSEAVTVAGGTPTLTLNDGGTATYTGGSGSNALTFSYTVAAGQNTSNLTATAVNLNSATITDGGGNFFTDGGGNFTITNSNGALTAASLNLVSSAVNLATYTGTLVSSTPGDLNSGSTDSTITTVGTDGTTYNLVTSHAQGNSYTPLVVTTVVMSDGSVTSISINGQIQGSGGGSGNAIVQGSSNQIIAANNAYGQTDADLILSAPGTAANLSLSGLTQTGPQIDTTTPVINSIVASPSSGDLDAGKTVTLTLTLSEAVTVAGGTPTLTLNDGGTATYTGGSGSSALTFSYIVAGGQNASDLTATAVNLNSATITDGAGNAVNPSISGLTQTGPQIDTTAPVISSIGESPSSGDLDAGKTVTLTLNLSEAVTVAGGTPTLTLNDGGTATYTGGSGSNTLTFSYIVGAGQNTSALTATAVNLNSATITDGAGNAVNPSISGLTQTGPQIDTTTPVISSIGESPSSGDFNAGNAVTLTLTLSEAVTVAGGTPTLTLNDGGTATYTGGSGSNALTFSYIVGAGQNTPDLTTTAVNLNGATIKDGAGNAANLSLSGLTQTGPQIDTVAPAAPIIANDTVNGDSTISLSGTAPPDSTVTIYDGNAQLGTTTATSSGAWSYTSGALTNGVQDVGATATDAAGNTSAPSNTVVLTVGQVTSPLISSIAESPSSGDLDAGNAVTLTLNFSEAVTVAGGTPTLTLNDGGTATYTGGSGSNALTFSYIVAAGQNTSALTATAVNLNSATITDGAGNAANPSISGLTQTGPQIDTTTPVINSIVESPSSGDLDAGNTVTLTLNLSEAVTVAGGTPTLTLNDGGTATYTGGSGTQCPHLQLHVAAGQNTSALTATAVNLNSATITDGAGNAANPSISGLTQTGPQIDTTTPVISSIVESPSSGDLNAGNAVTLTLNSERGSYGCRRHADAHAQ